MKWKRVSLVGIVDGSSVLLRLSPFAGRVMKPQSRTLHNGRGLPEESGICAQGVKENLPARKCVHITCGWLSRTCTEVKRARTKQLCCPFTYNGLLIHSSVVTNWGWWFVFCNGMTVQRETWHGSVGKPGFETRQEFHAKYHVKNAPCNHVGGTLKQENQPGTPKTFEYIWVSLGTHQTHYCMLI